MRPYSSKVGPLEAALSFIPRTQPELAHSRYSINGYWLDKGISMLQEADVRFGRRFQALHLGGEVFYFINVHTHGGRAHAWAELRDAQMNSLA